MAQKKEKILLRVHSKRHQKEVVSGLRLTSSQHDFLTPLIPSEERGVGDQNIQKWGLVQLPTILMPAFILLRNLLKQYFTEKGEATAPLADP